MNITTAYQQAFIYIAAKYDDLCEAQQSMLMRLAGIRRLEKKNQHISVSDRIADIARNTDVAAAELIRAIDQEKGNLIESGKPFSLHVPPTIKNLFVYSKTQPTDFTPRGFFNRFAKDKLWWRLGEDQKTIAVNTLQTQLDFLRTGIKTLSDFPEKMKPTMLTQLGKVKELAGRMEKILDYLKTPNVQLPFGFLILVTGGIYYATGVDRN